MSKRKTITLTNDSPRNIAVNSLLAFQRDKKLIQETLNGIFCSGEFESSQKRLATELAYGACRSLITLDYIISKHSNRSLPQIEPIVLQVLRVGLYQMIYLSRTPDFAAINEAVEQVKSCGLHGAGSFVNAVLRSVQRNIEGVVSIKAASTPRTTLQLNDKEVCQFKKGFLPDKKNHTAKHYSVSFGQPLWLIKRWGKNFDEETVQKICLANNSRPVLTLRPNSLKCQPAELLEFLIKAGIKAVQYDNAVQLLSPAVPNQLPGYEAGLFYVQDMTAMSVAPQLKPLPGQLILDLCAAPGGKTTHLAELMKNQGKIIACDVSQKKMADIEENCQRLGIAIVQTCHIDNFDQMLQNHGPFDAAVIDAPCSNTGVFARRVEARHLLKPAHIRRNAQTQLELLERAAQTVKPNGQILYSTCSIESAENNLLVQKFLQENQKYSLSHEKLTLPDAKNHHDGGYFALLKRN